MTTKIHSSTTCRAGVNGARCEMCEFAENASQANSSLSEAKQGLKIDSSPSSAPAITISVPTFEQEWRDAPKWATRTTEEDSARYWFIRGQHAREVELLVGRNSDLKEIARVVRERLGR